MNLKLSESAKVEIYNMFLNMNVDCEETANVRNEILNFFEHSINTTKKDGE